MGLLGTTSAMGTALGPSLGGALITGFGWRAMFLAMVPLGLLVAVLAAVHLAESSRDPRQARPRFDVMGILVLSLTLIAYALAMTLGREHFSALSGLLLLAAALGAVWFVRLEARNPAPLLRGPSSGGALVGAGLAMSAMVSTVMMATLVVGPFFLSRGLGLAATSVGLAMSVGPLSAAVSGLAAGRLADGWGPRRVVLAGLAVMGAGSGALALLPATAGLAGYLGAIAVLTAGYGLFQTANNTAVMAGIAAEHRGAASGMLNLSRNLGLITGAALMGLVFSWGTASEDLAVAGAAAISAGLRATFAVASALVVAALGLAASGRGASTGDAEAGVRS
jgi:MFS family permease